MADFSRKSIADGVGYSVIIDPKFKSTRIKVMFITELKEETAASNAIAVGVMGASNSRYKNISEITSKLNALYGASINIDIVKQGDFQRLCLGVTSINNRFALEGEDVNGEVLDILLDCIFSPNAQNGEFAKEPFDFGKKDLLDSIESEINNKRGYAVLQTQRKAFAGENSENSPYGTKETAAAVTPHDAYDAYLRLLTDSRVEVYFVGAEEDPRVEKKIAESFSKLGRKICDYDFIRSSPLKKEVLRVEEKLDVNQCKMVMAFKTENSNRYAMKFMNTIFGGTPFSKLFMNVREKLSLCYYCSSNYSPIKQALFVDCGVEEENVAKAEAEILNQLEEIRKGNFSMEDMENSLLSIENSLKGVGDTTGSYINWYYGCLVYGEVISPSETVNRYRAVTKEQIIEAAKSLALDTVYVMKGE